MDTLEEALWKRLPYVFCPSKSSSVEEIFYFKGKEKLGSWYPHATTSEGLPIASEYEVLIASKDRRGQG